MIFEAFLNKKISGKWAYACFALRDCRHDPQAITPSTLFFFLKMPLRGDFSEKIPKKMPKLEASTLLDNNLTWNKVEKFSCRKNRHRLVLRHEEQAENVFFEKFLRKCLKIVISRKISSKNYRIFVFHIRKCQVFESFL